jgi:hypothetical protein
MFKRIFILIIAPLLMLLKTTIYAEKIAGCDGKKDSACKSSSLELGVTALYYTTYSDLLPTNSNSTNSSANSPGNWGSILNAHYHLSKARDVTVDWLNYSVGYQGIRSTDTEYDVTTGKIKINSINAEMAQSFVISARNTIRLFAGAQYLKLTDNRSTNHFVANDLFYYSRNHKKAGVGPRIGLDTNYQLKGNFSAFANSAATILLARHTLSSSSISSLLISPSPPVNSVKTRDIAIPELEAKLGLTYNQPVAHGTASVSAGWSVINYFDLQNQNNLTLSGPFLQGRWVG